MKELDTEVVEENMHLVIILVLNVIPFVVGVQMVQLLLIALRAFQVIILSMIKIGVQLSILMESKHQNILAIVANVFQFVQQNTILL